MKKRIETNQTIYVIKEGQIQQEKYSINYQVDTTKSYNKTIEKLLESIYKAFSVNHPEIKNPKLLEIGEKVTNKLGQSLTNEKLTLTNSLKEKETISETIKRAELKNENNTVIGYQYAGTTCTANKKRIFYNWIYAKALQQHPEYSRQIIEENYNGFVNIQTKTEVTEFTPAEAVANFIKLKKKTQITSFLNDITKYQTVIEDNTKTQSNSPKQINRTAYIIAFTKLGIMAGISKQQICNWIKNYYQSNTTKQIECKDIYAYLIALMLGNSSINEKDLKNTIEEAEKILNEQEKAEIYAITYIDPEYPKQLKKAENPPPYIYYRGNKKVLQQKIITVIGTQNVGNTGEIIKEQTAKTYIQNIGKTMGQRATEEGWTTASSLNYGSDIMAQIGALNKNAATIAVIATGLTDKEIDAPKEIIKAILNKNGCIISENPIGTIPSLNDTKRKNQLKASLASGIMIVATGEKEDTWDTINEAIKQKKPICYYDYTTTKEKYDYTENVHTKGMEKIKTAATGETTIIPMSNSSTLKSFFAKCEETWQATK